MKFNYDYANLYDKKIDHLDKNLIEPFLGTVNTSKLTDEQRDSIDKQLTLSEKNFQEK